MEQHFVTDYMKDKEKQHIFKGVLSVLIGFMLVQIAIFTVVLFHFFFIACVLVIVGIICFILGIYVIKKVFFNRF